MYNSQSSNTDAKKPLLKIVIIAIIIAGAIIAGFYYWKKNKNDNPIPGPVIKTEILDKDYDGLPDKIEQILGTNPNNWDTDSDGFGDAVEIKKGYNPLLPGSAKFSPEEWNAAKEKIKTADVNFYNSFFGPGQNDKGDFSSPENTFGIFMKAIKQNNSDLFFSALDKSSIDSLNMKDLKGDYINNIPMPEIIKRLGLNKSGEIKYNLIEENDRFARMAPVEWKIQGEKDTIIYKNISGDKKVTIEDRSIIYLKKEENAWKIDVMMSMEDTIYRNSRKASEVVLKDIESFRDYWMNGTINP